MPRPSRRRHRPPPPTSDPLPHFWEDRAREILARAWFYAYRLPKTICTFSFGTLDCTADAPHDVPPPVPKAYPEPLSIEQDHPSRSLDESALEQIVRHVLKAEEATLVHLSVVLSNHTTVRRLNREYLDHDYNTDVLSFSLRDDPAPDTPVVEGEVYVDLDTAAERHEEFDTSFEREAFRYVVHGLLHLLDYDDATESGRETMREKETQYLNAAPSAPSPK